MNGEFSELEKRMIFIVGGHPDLGICRQSVFISAGDGRSTTAIKVRAFKGLIEGGIIVKKPKTNRYILAVPEVEI